MVCIAAVLSQVDGELNVISALLSLGGVFGNKQLWFYRQAQRQQSAVGD
jgi:hypothetical protein